MSSHRTARASSGRARDLIRVLPAALALCTLPGNSGLRAQEPEATANAPSMHHHANQPMTDEDMRRWVDDWFATHPRRGEPAAGTAAATINVFSFGFDADGNNSDVDTVQVIVGDVVTWHWLDGFHTVTNGNGVLDPNAGTLFDQPIDSSNPDFSYQFMSAGLVRFFCRPHQGLMSGFVNVQAPTDVVPLAGRDHRPGFTDGPAPNPTHDTATFRFALGDGGRVRVEVFDVRGRRIATAVDRTLAAGLYAAAWNGRSAAGERVPAGAYYLRLSAPGLADSREVIVTR